MNFMPYAGDELARRFLALSARELGVATLFDSVWTYLDVKADACARLANAACERVYYDSIATLLTNRPLSGASEAGMLMELALAQAALGRESESRRTLDRLFALTTPHRHAVRRHRRAGCRGHCRHLRTTGPARLGRELARAIASQGQRRVHGEVARDQPEASAVARHTGVRAVRARAFALGAAAPDLPPLRALPDAGSAD